MATQKTYKQLQGELDELLDKMQSGEPNIDEALKLYKKAQQIISQLEDYLKNVKNEVEHLKES